MSEDHLPSTEPICCWTIGNSDTDPRMRYVGRRELIGPDGSWLKFFKTRVEVCRNLGYRRFALQNPGGTNPSMDFSQFLQAKEAGMNCLCDGLTDLLLDGQSRGEEWTLYQGAIHTDPTIKALQIAYANADRAGDSLATAASRTISPAIAQQNLRNRIALSARIAIEGKASLAIDSLAVDVPWANTLADMVYARIARNQGTLFMESWLEKGDHRVQLWPRAGVWVSNLASGWWDYSNAQKTWAMPREVFAERQIIVQLSVAPGTQAMKADGKGGDCTNAEYNAKWAGCMWINTPEWINRWVKDVQHFGAAPTIPGDDIEKWQFKADSFR